LISSASIARPLDTDSSFSLNVSRSSTDGWRENSSADSGSIRLRYLKELTQEEKFFFDAYISESRSHLPGGVLGKVGEGNMRAAKFNNAGSFIDGNNATLRTGIARSINGRVDFEGEVSYRNRSSDLNSPYYLTADSVSQVFGYVTGLSRRAFELNSARVNR
jgi:hypothetical protein